MRVAIVTAFPDDPERPRGGVEAVSTTLVDALRAQGGVDLLEAARARLLLWDVRPADVDRLEETGEVRRSLSLDSPVTGYVTQKAALEGMRVTPAETLFDVADLSHLWVLADVYESDLAAVKVGMPAELTLAWMVKSASATSAAPGTSIENAPPDTVPV